jgi:glycosyltransferase involved in cell wall biosynthesis
LRIKKISIILPAYKQEKTIREDVESLKISLNELPMTYEIIVVIDGNMDKTYDAIKDLRGKNVKVLMYEKNEGKGFAVTYGMRKATGDVIGFIDAGMDISPASISMLINHMIWYDADVIVGSKLHPVSQVEYPVSRKILSWGWRTLTHLLFGFKIRDTQVGLKIFKKKVAKDVFPRLLVKKFAFDVEMLAVAYTLGYKRIYEAPVRLNFNNASSITSVGLWKAIFFMVIDTLAIFYRLKIIQYYRKSNKKNWLN